MIARCTCGRVELEALAAPIQAVACYCSDCQEAGRRIEALPGAIPMVGADGGTEFVLFRRDRVRWPKGAELLQPHKLKETSPTKRLVATCCHSAMALAFDDRKPWVSVYRSRLVGEVPAIEMCIFTKDKPAGAVLPNDVPAYAGFPLRFPLRIVAAQVARLIGR